MNFNTDKLLEQANLDEDNSSFSSDERTFKNEAEAVRVFSVLRAKLLNIKEWNEHSTMSSFAVFDENGREIADGKLSAGVFLRISLKGTAKYDWVRVVEIYEAADEFVITVKPNFDPTAETVDKSVVSHFFTDASSNNFCLLKRGKTLSLNVIGLNEKMNTSETGGIFEAARNAAVNIGSYLGMQKGEWEIFCHNFLYVASEEDAKTNAL